MADQNIANLYRFLLNRMGQTGQSVTSGAVSRMLNPLLQAQLEREMARGRVQFAREEAERGREFSSAEAEKARASSAALQGRALESSERQGNKNLYAQLGLGLGMGTAKWMADPILRKKLLESLGGDWWNTAWGKLFGTGSPPGEGIPGGSLEWAPSQINTGGPYSSYGGGYLGSDPMGAGVLGEQVGTNVPDLDDMYEGEEELVFEESPAGLPYELGEFPIEAGMNSLIGTPAPPTYGASLFDTPYYAKTFAGEPGAYTTLQPTITPAETPYGSLMEAPAGGDYGASLGYDAYSAGDAGMGMGETAAAGGFDWGNAAGSALPVVGRIAFPWLVRAFGGDEDQQRAAGVAGLVGGTAGALALGSTSAGVTGPLALMAHGYMEGQASPNYSLVPYMPTGDGSKFPSTGAEYLASRVLNAAPDPSKWESYASEGGGNPYTDVRGWTDDMYSYLHEPLQGDFWKPESMYKRYYESLGGVNRSYQDELMGGGANRWFQSQPEFASAEAEMRKRLEELLQRQSTSASSYQPSSY